MSRDADGQKRLWLKLGHGGKKAEPSTWRYWEQRPRGSRQWIISAPNNLAEFEQHDKTVFYRGEVILTAETQWSATWRSLAYFYEHVVPTLPVPPMSPGVPPAPQSTRHATAVCARLLTRVLKLSRQIGIRRSKEKKMPGAMKKTDAIARVNAKLPAVILKPESTHFANINSQKPVWWYDIDITKVKSGKYATIFLLAYDGESNQLHVLSVPREHFSENMERFVIREDIGKISLELSALPTNKFQDVRPTGGRVGFDKFLIGSV